MFDFLSNLRKSAAENRQEAITAYLDDALTAEERRQLEQQMAADPALRADMEQQRLIKMNISRLPRARAPRNFTLDPAIYGRTVHSGNARLYPAMRVATLLVGVFFIIAVGAEILTLNNALSWTSSGADQAMALAPAEDVLLESEAEMAMEAAPAATFEVQSPLARDGETFATNVAEVVEEGLLEEAPAEAAELSLPESEEAVEESFADTVVTAVAEMETQKIVTGEAPAESAPRAPTAVDELYNAAGAQPAEADEDQAELPSGGGAEPEQAPLPGILLTEVAGRSMATATLIAVPPEETVSEEPGEVVAEAPEPLPAGVEPTESRETNAGRSAPRLLILLLGITFILLSAVTLITRRRLRE